MTDCISLYTITRACSPSTEKLAQTLEIRDQEETDFSPPLSLHSSSNSVTVTPVHSHTIDSLTHHIEVQVLESGQVAMSSGGGFLSTESTPPVIARDTLTSLQGAETQVEPMTASSTPQSKGGLVAAALQRRAPGSTAVGNSGSDKATQEDQVEVDGQFDMPILDSVSSETTSTGTSAVMTFVMTSEGLSQTVSPEREKQQRQSPVPGNMRSVSQQTQHTSTLLGGKPPSQTPATPTKATPLAPPTSVAVGTSRNEQVKETESTDVATQTTSARMRSEVEDRTPLIIRRSRAGKVQKSAMPSNTKQQQPDIAVKLVELNVGNGNETGRPACKEVQMQTQLPSRMRLSSVGIQATEGVANQSSSNKEEVPSQISQMPRRSTRKSAHKVSPEKSQSSVAIISQPSTKNNRTSPARKSPAKTSPIASEGAQNLPRIRTRAVAKRCSLEEQPAERRDTPPAKRSRKAAVVERPVDNANAEGKHPQLWGVNEVAEFINGFQSDCTNTFREHVSQYTMS